MNVLFFVMFVIYLVLVIMAARTELFTIQEPMDAPHLNVENMMKDAKREERIMGRDLFEKAQKAMSKTATGATALIVGAGIIATFMLFGTWGNFGSKAGWICALGILAGFIIYTVIREKKKKAIYVLQRDKFKLQLGYILDTQTKTVNYIYKKHTYGRYHKGSTDFHKVWVGIIGEDGTPETYLLDMDQFTFRDVMKSEMCDVVTYDGQVVAACYLIKKKEKEISLLK